MAGDRAPSNGNNGKLTNGIKRKAKRGRKTKFTPKVKAALLKALSVGTPLEIACRGAGIHRETLRLWHQQAEAGDEEKRGFFGLVEEAQAKHVAQGLERIASAAEDPRYWKAQAWILERRYPKYFGQKMEVGGRIDSTHTEYSHRVVEILDDGEGRILAGKLARKISGPDQ
tara:strand:- start:793 stop:1305 length:513 start_codon:yes stop_codon:yes gene_type:complete